MADLSQTAASVKIKSQGMLPIGTSGEALTQGQPIYQSGGVWYRCDANDTAAKSICTAIVITPCATSGYFAYATPGMDVDLGATLAVGEPYAVSTTVGGICPMADLVSTNYICPLGMTTAAGTFRFQPTGIGTQKP